MPRPCLLLNRRGEGIDRPWAFADGCLRFTGHQTFLSKANQSPSNAFHETRITSVETVHWGTEALQSFFFRPGRHSMRTERTESGPECLTTWRYEVRERAGGTRREPPAPATRPVTRFFTKHDTRPFSRVLRPSNGEKCRSGSHHEKPPPGHCFPVPVRVAWRGIARQRGAPSGCPRTVRSSNTAFRVFAKHGLYRRPDRRARRPLTTSLRILTGPFSIFRVYCRVRTGLCRVRTGFCRLMTTFYRILTGQYPTILRNSSEFFGYPPSRCPRFVRCRSRRPPKCFRSGERKMNPC